MGFPVALVRVRSVPTPSLRRAALCATLSPSPSAPVDHSNALTSSNFTRRSIHLRCEAEFLLQFLLRA